MTTNQTTQAPSARKASAAYLNRISFFIQDNASDAGWEACQAKMAEANQAYDRAEFDQVQTLIDQAHAIAFTA